MISTVRPLHDIGLQKGISDILACRVPAFGRRYRADQLPIGIEAVAGLWAGTCGVDLWHLQLALLFAASGHKP
tara:strand:+ start:252 stop:470 length:219 start_codon:yes stop_codon:yes gene_type:complete